MDHNTNQTVLFRNILRFVKRVLLYVSKNFGCLSAVEYMNTKMLIIWPAVLLFARVKYVLSCHMVFMG